MTVRARRLVAGVLIALAIAGIVTAALLWGRPVWSLLRNPEALQRSVVGWGVWGWLGMIGLQALQVIVAPLPGNLVAIVAGYVFGIARGLLLCMLGILLGSTACFLLGRLLGRRLLRLFLPETTLDRFDAFALARGPFFIFLLLLFPNPLGDWLYYLAGLTTIPLPVFLLLVLAGRIPSNLLEAFLGNQMARFGSQAYRLAAWQWALVLAALLLVAGAYYFNRRRIERFFARFTRYPPADRGQRNSDCGS